MSLKQEKGKGVQATASINITACGKKFDAEVVKGGLISSSGTRRRYREKSLSGGGIEITAILIGFRSGMSANLKTIICQDGYNDAFCLKCACFFVNLRIEKNIV